MLDWTNNHQTGEKRLVARREPSEGKTTGTSKPAAPTGPHSHGRGYAPCLEGRACPLTGCTSRRQASLGQHQAHGKQESKQAGRRSPQAWPQPPPGCECPPAPARPPLPPASVRSAAAAWHEWAPPPSWRPGRGPLALGSGGRWCRSSCAGRTCGSRRQRC